MMKKTIVTAAITGGVHTPSMSPHLPITPTEIADEAVRAWKAGASVAHVHVRDPETGRPSADLGLYAEVLGRIQDRSDMIVCITTGGGLGQTVEQRVAPVRRFSPELASLKAGSFNFALFQALDSYTDFQFVLGVLGGLPATIQNVSFLYATARELLGEFEWSVCAAGKAQFRMCTASVSPDFCSIERG
jgi:uncharacterized protein (DUF849 family)